MLCLKQVPNVFLSRVFLCISNLKRSVGLDIPTIEVRFEHLRVEAEAYVGSRGLPTIFNFCVNMLEVYMAHLLDHTIMGL
jgi:hypothetical protein